MGLLDSYKLSKGATEAKSSTPPPQPKIQPSASILGDSSQKLSSVVKNFVKSWPSGGKKSCDTLRASGIYYECPREFVLRYWQPRNNSKFDYNSWLYMTTGTTLHALIQNTLLGPTGILKGKWRSSSGVIHKGFHPEPVEAIKAWVEKEELLWEYVEPVMFDNLYRIGGHADGIISKSRLKWLIDNRDLVKKDIVKACTHLTHIPSDPSEESLLEIKTTNDYIFKKLDASNPSAISDPYKMQASIYQHKFRYSSTLFWFICRDTMADKLIEYPHEPHWWNFAKSKSKIIFEAIRDETLPTAFSACKLPQDKRAKDCAFKHECFDAGLDFKKYVADGKKVANDTGRKLLDLSKLQFPK